MTKTTIQDVDDLDLDQLDDTLVSQILRFAHQCMDAVLSTVPLNATYNKLGDISNADELIDEAFDSVLLGK